MQLAERYRLIHRIEEGRVPFVTKKYEGYFRDPTGLEVANWEEQYRKDYDYAIREGLMSDNEAIQLAIKRGEWQEDWNIEALEKQIQILKKQIGDNPYKLDLQDRLKARIKEITDEKHKLQNIYNIIMSSGTARYYAFKSIVITKVTSLMSLSKGKAVSDNDYISLYNIIDKNEISTRELREIARTTPWMTRYRAARDHIGILFSDLTRLTFYQENLISWSQLYEYVYNHPEKPDSFIINDDDLLDRWLEEQDKKDKSKKFTTKSAMDSHDMIFIPTDKKGAQKVYDMNPKDSRSKIRQQLQKVRR